MCLFKFVTQLQTIDCLLLIISQKYLSSLAMKSCYPHSVILKITPNLSCNLLIF